MEGLNGDKTVHSQPLGQFDAGCSWLNREHIGSGQLRIYPEFDHQGEHPDGVVLAGMIARVLTNSLLGRTR